jgi:sugar phosphate isomerase/epimerase
MLADHGLEVAELDAATTWLPGSQPGTNASADEVAFSAPAEEDFYALADSIGGRSLNAVEIFGVQVPVDVAAEAFAGLCDRAAEHGLLVHLEFLPWSGIPDLASAWEIVRLADRPNGGVLVDSWHHLRSGQSLDSIRGVPGERITAVQLSDAPAQPSGSLVNETMTARLLPGHGDGQVVELVRVLDEVGCAAPVGVEVFSDVLRKLTLAETAEQAAEATRSVLREARQAS